MLYMRKRMFAMLLLQYYSLFLPTPIYDSKYASTETGDIPDWITFILFAITVAFLSFMNYHIKRDRFNKK